MKTPDFSREEAVEILKEIARDGRNGAARVRAVDRLLELDAANEAPAEGFDALDELAPRRAKAG